MSTGLTYVTLTQCLSTNEVSTSTLVFSSYEEAMSYGKWYAEFLYDFYFGEPSIFYITIYTTGPGQNGSYQVDNPASFTAFD
jgi:hypothetical protein